ncbi:hypothetical protein ACFWIB_35515 [Streptomyces sp. NPDC127051]|uniref:hypothetical protein n=1 Tax=Streptomyces sp. NPDC127051 TaxID=3347119 RepID=UPI003655AE45
MRRTLPGGRGGLGAGRGRQVCEGVLEGVGVDVVENQAVGGVHESRVDSAQVGGASGRYQQDAAAGGARGAMLGTSAGSLPSADSTSVAWWAILLRCWSVKLHDSMQELLMRAFPEVMQPRQR